MSRVKFHYITDVYTTGIPAFGSNATMGGGSVRLTTQVIIKAVQIEAIAS